MTTTKFQLTAIECVEYDLNTGWDLADHVYEQSQQFSSLQEAMQAKDSFAKGLGSGVYQIDVNKFTYDIDEETGEIDDSVKPEMESEFTLLVDDSENEPKAEYMLCQYFGTYMIAQEKYRLDFAPDLTANEIMLRVENTSYRWHPVELFANEEAAREHILNNDIRPVQSVIDLEEETDEENG